MNAVRVGLDLGHVKPCQCDRRKPTSLSMYQDCLCALLSPNPVKDSDVELNNPLRILVLGANSFYTSSFCVVNYEASNPVKR